MDVLSVQFEGVRHHVTRGVEVLAKPKPHVELGERRVAVADDLYEALAMGMGPCPRNGEFIESCPECGATMSEDRRTSTPTDQKVMGVTLYKTHMQHDQVQTKYRLTEANPVLINHRPWLVPAVKVEKNRKLLLFVEAHEMLIEPQSGDPEFKKFNEVAKGGFTKRAVVLGVKDAVSVKFKSEKGWEEASLVVDKDLQLKLHRLPTVPFKK